MTKFRQLYRVVIHIESVIVDENNVQQWVSDSEPIFLKETEDFRKAEAYVDDIISDYKEGPFTLTGLPVPPEQRLKANLRHIARARKQFERISVKVKDEDEVPLDEEDEVPTIGPVIWINSKKDLLTPENLKAIGCQHVHWNPNYRGGYHDYFLPLDPACRNRLNVCRRGDDKPEVSLKAHTSELDLPHIESLEQLCQLFTLLTGQDISVDQPYIETNAWDQA